MSRGLAMEFRGLRSFGIFILCAVTLLAGVTGSALGQTTTGTITGTITDAKGAAMVGVMVVVHNVDTGVDQRPVMTNDSGIYTVPLLQPGNYEVTSSQTGFATVQHKGITVQVGLTSRIDVEMPVASQQSLVTVTTEAPLIETEKTEQSQNINENLVTNLPTSSRRWEQFVLLTPGVTPDGPTGLVGFHGINSLYNNNSVDGANNNNQYGGGSRGAGEGYAYSGDSIREFQVGSGNFTADIGQAAGGAVNAVTKSGTSQFHGDLFYNGRAANFNALDPVAKNAAASAPAGTSAATPTQSVHQQHQYGVSVGGPLIKDRLFFFTTLDAFRKINPLAIQTSQLSPPISSFACPTLALGIAPGFYTAAQQTTLNTQCAAAKSYVFAKVLGNFPKSVRQDIELLKLDYQLNQSNHLNAVTNIRDFKQPTLITQSGGTSYAQQRFIIANWNIVIGNNKVNELRYQWGIDHSFGESQPVNFAPASVLSNLFTYGKAGAFFPPGNTETRNQISDNFSFTKGTHSFKTGVDINIVHDRVNSANTLSGSYSYSSAKALGTGVTCTNAAAQTPNNIFCDWILDLFGVPTGVGTTTNTTGQHWASYSQFKDQRFSGNALATPAGSDEFTSHDYAAYFQDTWKMRPNVTVNLGLRYDLQVLPPQPNPNNNSPLLAYYTNTMNVDKGGIQPRIGVAWNLAKNTVLRGGGGIFFSKISVSGVSSTHRTSGTREQSFTCSPGVAVTPCQGTGSGLTYPNVLYAQEIPQAAPFTIPGLPANQQPLTPQVMNPGQDSCIANVNCATRGLSPDLANPRAYEAQIALERQLPGNMSFSASYVFTRGNHLPQYTDANVAPTTTTKSYDVLAANAVGASTLLTATVPFYTKRLDQPPFGACTTVLPSSNLCTGAILAQYSIVNSTYHAMILTVRKPMSHGVELLANYTLSKATDDGEASYNGAVGPPGVVFLTGPGYLDPYNLKLEQARSGTDNRNRFTASVVWAPTFAKGISNRIARQILDGWAMSSTVIATNGTRYTAFYAVNGKAPGGLDGGLTGAVLQTSATPVGGRISWLPRDAFALPSYANIDFRLAKQFSIRERFHIEIRGEAFNLFNSTIVQAVNGNAYTDGTQTAGTVIGTCSGHTNACLVPQAVFQQPTTTTGTLLGPRQLQAGIRFTF